MSGQKLGHCCFLFVGALFVLPEMQLPGADGQSWLADYDVVWNTPSKDARGSMPLGNGEVTLNVWVETNGVLQFYIGRSDSYSEISRLLKVGLLRISLSPNPFQNAETFSQHLNLQDGVIEISGGEKSAPVSLKVFAHPDSPVIYVSGEATRPLTAKVQIESWREASREIRDDSTWTMSGAPHPLIETADHFPNGIRDAIVWYHRNESTVVGETLEHQGMSSAAAVVKDPLIHRTFGGYVTGSGFEVKDSRTLVTDHATKTFELRVAVPCEQADDAAQWLKKATGLGKSFAKVGDAVRRNAEWWRQYWQRSWIRTTGHDNASAITRGYVLQRFMQGCDGRGVFPIKFNGGAFTVGREGRMDDADFRRWGDCHWFQNIRHMYYPMMQSGDFEMTEPFFRMYESVTPLCEARARLYEDVQGVYFPETMTVWGSYANKDYGWDRKGHKASEVLCEWWGKTRNQGPELVGMMLDRWDYSQDSAFLKDHLLPMAVSVLEYFNHRFPRDASGKLILAPTQVIETYWKNVTNDTPTIAGLRNVCLRLCDLPSNQVAPTRQGFFKRMLAACPEQPLEEKNLKGKAIPVLAPARRYEPHRSNVENPELYPVWPFLLYGVGKEQLQMAKDTYANRGNHLDNGWGPDGNCAAVLGLADEAARILKRKCENSNSAYRWPATWGPNFDWMPDQNHGGNLLNTAQLMLLQADGRKIILFPAWPRNWDVDFKLHAPYRTEVEATLRGGKLIHLKVVPESRAKDVLTAF